MNTYMIGTYTILNLVTTCTHELTLYTDHSCEYTLQPTETVLLDMPVHLLGTLCRTLSNAVHTVYLLSDVI